MDAEPTTPTRGGTAVFEGLLPLMVQGSRLMVQGMKRQNGISKMKSINMGDDKKEDMKFDV